MKKKVVSGVISLALVVVIVAAALNDADLDSQAIRMTRMRWKKSFLLILQ